MAMTALIIDDEPLARQELEYLLEKSGDIEVLAQGSNGIEAVELIREHHPDVVFLDVQMPGLDGFAVLKKLIGKVDRMPQVVFATAYDQYAVRAFEVNAIDYLLKPFDQARVERTVEKARHRVAAVAAAEAAPQASSDPNSAKLDALMKLLEEQTQQAAPPARASSKVVVRAQNRLLLVDQKHICFAAIDEGQISIVTQNVEGVSNCRTLEELTDQLNPEIFWRAHRSFVVNIHHIREVVPWFKSSYQLRMDDRQQTEIPVSRAQTKRLKELFNL
ncbi:LytR/AlgR family response regulator transcription factor [Terriglobus tenax]|uniref:LytR/AlgR family response regulator transcription factor n=1 Tax=Terriglobus tenax TaxID=1111115 RepID=UPI0021E06F29|nr:response regulator [Terriglobus tenax]